MSQIELSVAMIFKNEIRCLERCLKSLQPLRERFSMELVMADTGSTDGSRAVAEKYADVLFDFPWIDDFSAARNATLDRCSGDWVLVVDSDEWLDPNLDELEAIVRGPATVGCDGATVLQRNYFTQDLDYYNDFPAYRIMRMANKPRYFGAIHESWGIPGRRINTYISNATILHHDGYIMVNDGSERGKAKTARNLKLLREEVRREPDNPLRRLQLLESGFQEPDYQDMLKDALALKGRLRKDVWQIYGPIYYRYALAEANKHKLTEWEQWWEEAVAEFPKSYYTRVDIYCLDVLLAIDQCDYERAIQSGEMYLQAVSEFRADPLRMLKATLSSLRSASPRAEAWIRIQQAEAEQKLGRTERAVARLRLVPWSSLDAPQIISVLAVLIWCYAETAHGWDEVLREFWKGIGEEAPNAAVAAKRRSAFLSEGGRIFRSDYFYNASTGTALDGVTTSPWELFLPLAGSCVLGDAAALMRCASAEEADAILERVETLRELPAKALIHALRLGADFPPAHRTLSSGDLDALALSVAEDAPFLRSAAISAAFAAKTPQDILWARALTLAALRSFADTAEKDRWPLVCAFARIQSLFLPLCYGGGALLREEYLPSLYRFGLHLARAVAVMEPSLLNPGFVSKTRNAHDAVAELRLALRAAPDYKDVVSCALDRL